MNKFIFLLIHLFFLSVLISAQDFTGDYSTTNPTNGITIDLSLNQNSNGKISGRLTLNGNDHYNIDGKVERDYEDSWIEGSIVKGNETSFFEAYLESDQLMFTWIPSNGNNRPDYYSAVDVIFIKGNSKGTKKRNTDMYGENNNYQNRKEDNYQRDPALIGYWRYSESYTSGDFSMVTEKYMEVRPDGTYSYGNGKVAGGGDSGTFDSGNGGDVIHGKWRTENGLIYIDEGYGQWVPYSGYYVEGNSLMLKFNDGSKQIWHRQ